MEWGILKDTDTCSLAQYLVHGNYSELLVIVSSVLMEIPQSIGQVE